MNAWEFGNTVTQVLGHAQQGSNDILEVKAILEKAPVTAIGVNEDGSPFEFGVIKIGFDELTNGIVVVLGPKL